MHFAIAGLDTDGHGLSVKAYSQTLWLVINGLGFVLKDGIFQRIRAKGFQTKIMLAIGPVDANDGGIFGEGVHVVPPDLLELNKGQAIGFCEGIVGRRWRHSLSVRYRN